MYRIFLNCFSTWSVCILHDLMLQISSSSVFIFLSFCFSPHFWFLFVCIRLKNKNKTKTETILTAGILKQDPIHKRLKESYLFNVFEEFDVRRCSIFLGAKTSMYKHVCLF